ncbi:MAG TPA: carbohydrate porin [Rhizomicrobium sp.]
MKTGARCVASLAALAFAAPALAEAPPDWSLHGQATVVWLYQPAFRSPYQGANSLDPVDVGKETFDLTLFAGVRLWEGGEAYADPEIDQGFGLSNTLGVAGYPSGEAYKVGKAAPYFRLQRLFFRQTFDLGGDTVAVESAANQLAGARTADTVVLTAGKFSVTDIFDANALAHDPKADFLNWSLLDTGSFDYAADAWGYAYGGAAEWTQDWWTLRAGLFDLSRVPNTTELTRGFGQYEIAAEGEARHTLFGRPGVAKLLGFFNRGRMGSYNDAVALGAASHATPDTALVRRPSDRAGVSLNLEQDIADDWSAFLRAGFNDGSKEAFEFTEINRTVALGISVKGSAWDRPGDTVGLAVVDNAISGAARRYFAAGGLGILIGDGALRHAGDETILETYYSLAAGEHFSIGADYQWIHDPAYDADRGPVSVFGLRLHAAG